jgi:hypothetical protein
MPPLKSVNRKRSKHKIKVGLQISEYPYFGGNYWIYTKTRPLYMNDDTGTGSEFEFHWRLRDFESVFDPLGRTIIASAKPSLGRLAREDMQIVTTRWSGGRRGVVDC